MNKPNNIERGAAASAALLITLTVVWSMGAMGYPSPVAAKPGITAGVSTTHCRPG